MKVRHRIDAENVSEHRNQNEVTDQTENVASEIFEEIDWPKNKWHDVDCQHDYTCQDKPREVIVTLRDPLPCRLVENQVLWVEAGCCKVEDHTNNGCDCDGSKDCDGYDEARLGTIERQGKR